VNASSSSFTREVEVQSKIRKVRTFGRAARTVFAALFGFGLVGSVGMLLLIVVGPIHGADTGVGLPGLDGVTTAQLTTPALKLWVFVVVGLTTGISLAAVRQLYHLFGNLAAGAIYTPENVRRVRYVGLLALLSAVVEILIPVASAALVTYGLIDGSAPVNRELVFPWQSVSVIISAGLILLASWIMDVGLYEKDHADALRRDADLVI
jgi:hypothetical protein